MIIHGEEDWLVKMAVALRVGVGTEAEDEFAGVALLVAGAMHSSSIKWVNPLFYFCSSKLVRRARVAQPVAKAEMNWFVPCGKPPSKYS